MTSVLKVMWLVSSMSVTHAKMSMVWTTGQLTLASVIIYGREKLNCWHCNKELIWGSDYDISDENDAYVMMTVLSCPKCNSLVEVYYPKEEYENDEV